MSISPAQQTMRTFYPEAVPTQDSVSRFFQVVKAAANLEPSQIMLADSICSDDLNAIEYPKKAYEMLGPFKLGGLNGFPFAGLTGMGAFAHHVPEDGAVFVFYAPHVGITKTGALGEILRPGQSTTSTCCGAARAALGKLVRGELKAGPKDELDYQQNTLEQILLEHQDRILNAENQVFEATEVFYEGIEARIKLLATRTQYHCKHLFLMGAILLNGDHDVGSFCEVRRLLHIDPHTGTKTYWLPAWKAIEPL